VGVWHLGGFENLSALVEKKENRKDLLYGPLRRGGVFLRGITGRGVIVHWCKKLRLRLVKEEGS